MTTYLLELVLELCMSEKQVVSESAGFEVSLYLFGAFDK